MNSSLVEISLFHHHLNCFLIRNYVCFILVYYLRHLAENALHILGFNKYWFELSLFKLIHIWDFFNSQHHLSIPFYFSQYLNVTLQFPKENELPLFCPLLYSITSFCSHFNIFFHFSSTLSFSYTHSSRQKDASF